MNSRLYYIKSRAEPNMLKFLPIIPSRTSQIFDPLFLTSSPITPVIFIVSVIIMSTIHRVTIILMNRILPVQTFLQNLHEILLPSWTSSPSSFVNNL